MKKVLFFLLLCMAMCLHSCYDDSALWKSVNDHSARLTKLETLCNQMNSDISTLKSLVSTIQNGGYITDVIPLTENGVEVGYKITLSDGKIISIRHGNKGDKGDTGDQGHTPEIAVKKDTDGKYYWVVDGTWLLDGAGNKVQVAPEEAEDGITPIVKIENGMWCVSYNNGTTWDELGPAVAENTCIFKDAKYENGILTLYFDDENMLPLPVGSAFKIVLGEYADKGRDIEIPYTIQGTTGEVMLFAITSVDQEQEDDCYIWVHDIVEESANSGKIILRSYWEEKEYNGKLAIFAVNEAGTTVSKIIRVNTAVVKELDEDKYIFGPEATQFEIKLSTNRNWDVKTDADWVTHVETKAVMEKSYVFNVQQNTGDYRNTEIHLISGDKTITVPVYQKTGADIFKVDITTNDMASSRYYVELSKKLINSEGKTIFEELGYSTWKEFVQAFGNLEETLNGTGNIIIQGYDLSTGELIGADIWSDGNTTIRCHNKYMYFELRWDSLGGLKNQSYLYWNHSNFKVGEMYSFGVMFSSSTATAYIEFNIKMEQYVDPEAGKYTNPQVPGSYEFDIKDEIEIHIPYVSGQSTTSYYNESIFEKIKQTIGMTSYELWKTFDTYNFDLQHPDKNPNTSNMRFDSDGNIVTANQAITVNVYGLSGQSTDKAVAYALPTQYDDNDVRNWKQPVLDAVEKGTVFKYKYILNCNVKDKPGTYSFVFNVETKIKKKESSL